MIEIEEHAEPVTPKQFLEQFAPPDMASLIVGYVAEDGSLKLHSVYRSEAHLIALLGALRTYVANRDDVVAS